jgi:hypothetical protein
VGPAEQQQLRGPAGQVARAQWLTFDPSHTIVTGANYVLPPKGVGCNADDNPSTGAARQAVDVCSTEIPWLNGNYSVEKATSQTLNLEGEWDNGGSLSGSFNVGRTWATGGPSVQLSMAAKPRNFVNGQWVDGSNGAAWTLNGKPTITASPDVLQNMLAGAGQVDLGSTGSNMVNTSNSQNFAQADLHLGLRFDLVPVAAVRRQVPRQPRRADEQRAALVLQGHDAAVPDLRSERRPVARGFPPGELARRHQRGL